LPWRTQHHDRHGGRGFLHRLAILVEHGAHAPELGAGDDRITHMERSALHEHGRHCTASLLDGGFDDHSGGQAGTRRTQLQHLRLQQDRVQQLVDPLAGAG